ncbi:MAG: hypothetical protein EAZ55_00405 [Cytophagales bacterium]|nr:MAG: hypothetical protein EAZ55_00405 [Cytophagales bacterium]
MSSVVLLIVLGALLMVALMLQGAFKNVYEEVQLLAVVDGDTLLVSNKHYPEGVQVHLIGIDAPELASETGDRDQYYARNAADFVRTKLRNSNKVFLEFDRERYNHRDQLLAYVYATKNGSSLKSLNAEMIQKGYARAVSQDPNVRYDKHFRKLENEARRRRLGIWRKG